MSFWVALFNNIAVSVFGSLLSASYCDTLKERKQRCVVFESILLFLVLQGIVVFCWGEDIMRKVYPLVVHLPLFLMLIVLKKKILWPLFSIFSAYLCCELRRWFALLIVAVFSGDNLMQDTIELVITLPLLLFLLQFASPVVKQLSEYNIESQIQFGLIPTLYYIFDYFACVYTDLLFTGRAVIVEFMPFVCCIAYLIFLLDYSKKERMRMELKQVQEILDLQLNQAVQEIDALRKSQALTSQYRHDLRHHLQYLYTCLKNGQEEQAEDYISQICQQIENQKVQRFCENETANLILSSFYGRAEKESIPMEIHAVLPCEISVSDSDLCVVLSNALENAIHACHPLVNLGKQCVIRVQLYERNNRLFLEVRNTCEKEIEFENGIPVANQEGHGVGTQSICAIVERYGGIYNFLVENGQFILRLSL